MVLEADLLAVRHPAHGDQVVGGNHGLTPAEWTASGPCHAPRQTLPGPIGHCMRRAGSGGQAPWSAGVPGRSGMAAGFPSLGRGTRTTTRMIVGQVRSAPGHRGRNAPSRRRRPRSGIHAGSPPAPHPGGDRRGAVAPGWPSRGHPAYRARQVIDWVVRRRAESFDGDVGLAPRPPPAARGRVVRLQHPGRLPWRIARRHGQAAPGMP